LRRIAPQVFEDGKINFETLKALLEGKTIVSDDERFYLNWAGKNNVFKLIQTPAYGTLNLEKGRSVDWDKTENLVIVGENMETLKLLLKPYFERVKCIYIDPPYNTGGDFIYKDNFAEPVKDYLEKTGQTAEGVKLTSNPETSGRYHSDWLNFMYPRLFLAKNLLTPDGVIFVSIDDHEIHHLRRIMDELFGEENFRNTLILRRGVKSVQKQFETTDKLAQGAEYILVYTRSMEHRFSQFFLKLPETRNGTWNNHWRGTNRPSMRYELFGVTPKTGQWRWSQNRSIAAIKDYERLLTEVGKLPNEITEEEIDAWYAKEVEKGKQPDLLRLSKSGKPEHYVPPSDFKLGSSLWTDMLASASHELMEIFGSKVSENPKPTALIKRIIQLVCNENDIVLDFFAGSGTTGHAVWALNERDGGNRKYILVQLDEAVNEKTEAGKNALSLGLKTVADICIERLKRVSDKYQSQKDKKDFGFKVFRLGKSNFNLCDEFAANEKLSTEETRQKYLETLGLWINAPLMAGYQELDVAYEVLLKEGSDLNSNINRETIGTNNFFHIVDNYHKQELFLCLDRHITAETVATLCTKPYVNQVFVFLDSALSDSDKMNLKNSARLKVI